MAWRVVICVWIVACPQELPSGALLDRAMMAVYLTPPSFIIVAHPVDSCPRQHLFVRQESWCCAAEVVDCAWQLVLDRA